jgi:hypothetical protein
VTDVDTDKHSLVGNLSSERHTPEITTDLSVHLSDDVHEDTIVVLGDSAVCHKL